MQENFGTPWGFSESAFNLRDLHSNYQYKAFGIPWLGLKRGLADEMVISSYGCILAINDAPKDVIENVKKLEKLGMKGKYGLYESIDFTPERVPKGKTEETVKTYMAHHQALILLAINNLFNNNILQKRFMNNPEMESLDILLQEKMPETALVTKEKKEKIEKIKYTGYESYSETIYNKIDDKLNRYNIISNGEYSNIINERGEGYSKHKNIIINRYKETADVFQGINFFIKQTTGNTKVWSSSYRNDMEKPDNYVANFATSEDRFKRKDDEIETSQMIVVDPNNPVEIRRLEIKNNGQTEQEFEITSYMEPVLSTPQADYSHMAFNNLFLKYEMIDGNIVVKRKGRNKEDKTIYLAINLISNDNDPIDYEINKEKLYGRSIEIPEMIEKSIPFSNSIGLVTEPCIAMRKTVKIKPEEKIVLNLVISVGEEEKEVIDCLEKYKNIEVCERVFDLAKVKAEEEARYLGVKGQEIKEYQKTMSYLLFQNPANKKRRNEYAAKYTDKDELCNQKVLQKDLWRYGISGDLPILLLKIRNVNDKYIVKDILKAFEYLRAKNVEFDLVIINEEESSYERYIKEMIENEILNSQLEYLQNVRSGIFVINKNETENIEGLEFFASLVLDSKYGNLKSNLIELEELIIDENEKQSIEKRKKIDHISDAETIEFDNNSLISFNGFGGFTQDGKEYKFLISKENPLPAVWSNVLANKEFGTLITSNLGGFSWNRNSRLNRLTVWGNNSVEDIPSEIIYIQDEETNEYWSMSPKLNNKNISIVGTYGFGYAKFECNNNQINHALNIFVPEHENFNVNILHLENKKPEKRNLRVLFYLKPVLGEDELKSNGFINVKKRDNVIYIQNLYAVNGISETMYVSSSEKIVSFTGDKKSALGQGTLVSPEIMEKKSLNNNNGLGISCGIAIELQVEMDAFSSKDISLFLGEEKSADKINDIVKKYSSLDICNDELRSIKKYWNDLLSKVTVNTECESMNILLNGWLAYQTIVCRLYARSAFYQSGGAFGFRDQLQDTLGLKFLSEEFMKNQIIKHCSHQFIEGDVEHWWHDETNAGIRTKFSDDLLWLPYVVSEYISFTGDYSILDIEVEYRKGEVLTNNEDEKYEEHLISEEKESIYRHCLRAIDRSLNFGVNGLPKIGTGDWNDGFSTVGNKGKGESVWLGFFIYDILNKFIKIAKYKGENELVDRYESIKFQLRDSLNTNAWDGKWYKRAFTDDGNVLGSAKNDECKIDNIAQSWSVISSAGEDEKKQLAMQSMEQYLVDEENSIIKLLDPPFENSSLEPGYIKSYLPGVRENGGQYTHSAIWAIIAECILEKNDKAFKYFSMLNPIEHSKTTELARKYKVEPYVVAADVYGKDNLTGRGGWTWYTGSASWMYKAGIEYILGLKIENNELEIKPCIPKEWKEFSIQYKYKTSVYNIKYENNKSSDSETRDKIIYVNDKKIEGTKIKLLSDGQIYNIVIK